jgi:hypothetical protein
MITERLFNVQDLPEISRQLGLYDAQERLVALYRIRRSLHPGIDNELLGQIAFTEQAILRNAADKRNFLHHLGFK